VVENCRTAHAIGEAKGPATTEEMRQAMVYCRTLFAELVCECLSAAAPVGRQFRGSKPECSGHSVSMSFGICPVGVVADSHFQVAGGSAGLRGQLRRMGRRRMGGLAQSD
jgi:hypothetical protein